MYEELINEVVDEVIRRMESHAKEAKEEKRKGCIVLGPCSQHLRSLLSLKYEIMIFEQEESLSYDDILSYVSQSELILITKLTISNLCRLAQGSCDTLMETFVTHALLLGKKIILLEGAMSYHDYKLTASKNYYRKLLEYEETLFDYGIRRRTEPELLVEFEHKQSSEPNLSVKQKAGDLMLNHRLITQKELMNQNFVGVQRLLISKASIVTPMAMDIIREHNLELIKY